MKEQKNGYGIASFVLSLLGFIGFVVPYIFLLFSVLAIVFAVMQSKKYGQTGLSTAGFVLGILGVIWNLLWLLAVVFILNIASAMV